MFFFLFFSLANALTFFSIKTSFIWVIVTYGVMSKFGSSVAYGPPVQTSIKVNYKFNGNYQPLDKHVKPKHERFVLFTKPKVISI